MIFLFFLALLASASSQSAPLCPTAVAVSGGGFEAPSIASGSFQAVGPSGWSSSGAQLGSLLSPFENAYPQEGPQFFIAQGPTSLQQTLTLPPGTSTLSVFFLFAKRLCCNYVAGGFNLRVYFNGVLVDSFVPPEVTSWTPRAVASAVSSPTVVLRIETAGNQGDESVFVDAVAAFAGGVPPGISCGCPSGTWLSGGKCIPSINNNVVLPGGTCGSSTGITTTPGMYKSHSGAGVSTYGNFAGCPSTTFIAPAGATISFTLTYFNMELSYDYLYLYDGPSTAFSQIVQKSGTSLGTWTTTGSSLSIKWTSDSSYSFNGAVANVRFNLAPSNALSAPAPWSCFSGVDFFGGDLPIGPVFAPDLSSCLTACLSMAGCASVTFSFSEGWCFAKTSTGWSLQPNSGKLSCAYPPYFNAAALNALPTSSTSRSPSPTASRGSSPSSSAARTVTPTSSATPTMTSFSASCPASYYCTSGAPVLCPKGFYCPLSSSTPTLCPAGFYCPLASSGPVPCPAGSTSVNGSSTCTTSSTSS